MFNRADLTAQQRSTVGRPRRAVVRLLPDEGGFALPKQRERFSAFTLTELLVTMSVLVLLVFLFTQLLNSAATIMTVGNKRMDADSQARQLLDRMNIDFAQMVKRPDVDYYLKSSLPASDCGVCRAQAGNDQAAFYSKVLGYYPAPTANPTATPIGASPASLVSYRVNSDTGSAFYNRMQRMGKGLAWNGVSTGLTPVVFLPLTIAGNWAAATDTTSTDSDYEVIGPQVFRFEYYYLLKGVSTTTNAIFTDTPWDTRTGILHTNVSGMRDVAAIVVGVAVIEPKSKALLDNSAQVPPPNDNITRLGARLIDWGNTTCTGCPSQTQWQTTAGQLLTQWQAALDANTLGLPRPAISGIRLYERYFYLYQ